MNDKTLSPEESLELITKMITKAKSNFAGGGSFYFLLWGSVVTIANLGHYAFLQFTDYPHPYIVWLLILPAAIWSTWYGFKKHGKMKGNGTIDHIYGQLWWAIFLCIVVTLFFMETIDYQSTPLILMFAALGTYVTGQILRFRPLILGGIVLFAGAIIAFLLPRPEQHLLSGLAMILGYLVPGFILKKREGRGI